jgi:hypothetical protein
MLALFTQLEADLKDIHREMREVIAIMDRIIASSGCKHRAAASIDDPA